ncbi:MAG: NAD-dependent DNA ligase LigA, partial [Mariprofundales bacterium]|nr:NAD-dependent DNA ligase LigA [Mariprofundales bacterium]
MDGLFAMGSTISIDQLRRQLAEHNHHYYIENRPRISDAEYDALLLQLQQMEQADSTPVPADSPSQTVGAPPSTSFATCRHLQPMLSLANAFNDDDLTSFFMRIHSALPEEEQITFTIDRKS